MNSGMKTALRTATLAALLAQAAGPTAAAGDVARGEALAASRQQGLCVLCHALPGQPAAFQGNIGPPLAGVGARLSVDDLRQRLLAPERFNPETVMPSYGRTDRPTDPLLRVPAALRGQPLLSPTQVDDLVAWLASLR
jgi:sulfur-oxidizing protein SoxX